MTVSSRSVYICSHTAPLSALRDERDYAPRSAYAVCHAGMLAAQTLVQQVFTSAYSYICNHFSHSRGAKRVRIDT